MTPWSRIASSSDSAHPRPTTDVSSHSMRAWRRKIASAAARPAGIPLSKIEAGERATIYRITEEAEEDAGLLSYLEARALRPGAHVTVLARSGSLDSLTLEGPLGLATLGLRPASLVHVLRGEADPALFHRVPTATT